MRIGHLADHSEFVPLLASSIWAHWKEVLPEDTAVGHRMTKLHAHMQKNGLPMALVAHKHGAVLGTAAIRLHDLEGREELSPWLGGVFVLPAHRNKGVASALCLAVKEQARVMGIPALYLFTPDQQHMYERLGWQVIEPATWRGLSGSIMLVNTTA